MIDQLPNSPESERAVLGSAFLDESVFAQVATLDPSIFYSYRQAFVAMRNVADRKEAIHPITVHNELKQIDAKTSIGVAEMTNWTYGLPIVQCVDEYISIIKDKALKRSLIKQCNALATEASEEAELGVDLASRAASIFHQTYSQSLNGSKPTVTLEEAFESNYIRWDKMLNKEIVTIETGIESIDSQLTGGGFEKGMFHVIGARPGKGKTTIGLDIATHNLFQGKIVVFFTLELSKDVLIDRLIAPLAGIPRYKITSKWMDEHDKSTLIKVSEAIKTLPLFINARARSLREMRAALKDIANQTGGKIDLVIVDFLTRMEHGHGSTYESVSANAGGIADFATEFGCASIALAQLSRENEKRISADPDRQGEVRMTDFRDSGKIEELGRTILGLWGSDDSKPYRKVKISCLKQGEGGLFDVESVFDTDYMTFGVRKNLLKRG
jgi:replicative DNA helicase